jgi:hypothetical protein
MKDFTCIISDDVIEKFNLALALNKEDADGVMERLMAQYISESFSQASQSFRRVGKPSPPRTVDTGKALNRIPKWAARPDQYNHKIIRAFFQVEKELGYVTFIALEKRCGDEVKYPTTYVRDFRGNFNQMKIDAPKSHGKVFEVNNEMVELWDYTKGTLLEYKDYFCR